MVRGPGVEHGNKVKITTTVPPDLYEWMMDRIEDGRFYNLTHAVEHALKRVREEEG